MVPGKFRLSQVRLRSLLSAPVDRSLERCTWFECYNPRCGNLQFLAGLGIAAIASTSSFLFLFVIRFQQLIGASL